MSQIQGWSARRLRLMNALHARRAGRVKLTTAFQSPPEPRTIGSHLRGKQLMAGNFLIGGNLVKAPLQSIWAVRAPDLAFARAVHGFGWLDDLAAFGTSAARARAQDWCLEWIARFGTGTGPGWVPDLTGRRLIRLISQGQFLLAGPDSAANAAFFASLAQQVLFLSRRWHVAPAGLPRFEALVGLIIAGLGLHGMEAMVAPATTALAQECTFQIDVEGGIATRNPEELLEVFTLLTWAASSLAEAGWMPPRDHLAAIERIAPTLRALRHADGGLARFHGGGRGAAGRLDQALAASGVRAAANTGLAMGYARLSEGRTSVIVDASPPPNGTASAQAHASTLAFELTSGRRPLIVSCGSGAPFGPDWGRAGRATASHSTLAIEGFSSSRLAPTRRIGGLNAEMLVDLPGKVNAQRATGPQGISLIAGHDGYLATHGLTHVRRLHLSFDGRALTGEDTLGAMTEADRKLFDRVVQRSGKPGVRYRIRFHLHPDVDAALDMGGAAVSLALKSGEVWVFRAHGGILISLESSVYLEKNRLEPRGTKQIVLMADVIDYASQVSWTLAKAHATPQGLRDLEPDARQGLD